MNSTIIENTARRYHFKEMNLKITGSNRIGNNKFYKIKILFKFTSVKLQK